MASRNIKAIVQQRHDTSANWSTKNPVLLVGEIGFESDTNKFKIGDGKALWNALDYQGEKSGGDLVLRNVTLSSSNWVDERSTNGYCRYRYNNAAITSASRVDVMFNNASMSLCSQYGLQQFVFEYDGYAEVFASSLPAKNLVCDIYIYAFE